MNQYTLSYYFLWWKIKRKASEKCVYFLVLTVDLCDLVRFNISFLYRLNSWIHQEDNSKWFQSIGPCVHSRFRRYCGGALWSWPVPGLPRWPARSIVQCGGGGPGVLFFLPSSCQRQTLLSFDLRTSNRYMSFCHTNKCRLATTVKKRWRSSSGGQDALKLIRGCARRHIWWTIH